LQRLQERKIWSKRFEEVTRNFCLPKIICYKVKVLGVLYKYEEV